MVLEVQDRIGKAWSCSECQWICPGIKFKVWVSGFAGSELDWKVLGPFQMSMDVKGCPGLNITVWGLIYMLLSWWFWIVLPVSGGNWWMIWLKCGQYMSSCGLVEFLGSILTSLAISEPLKMVLDQGLPGTSQVDEEHVILHHLACSGNLIESLEKIWHWIYIIFNTVSSKIDRISWKRTNPWSTMPKISHDPVHHQNYSVINPQD